MTCDLFVGERGVSLTNQCFGVREEGVVVIGWLGANGKRLFSVGVSVLAICLLASCTG